MESLLLTMLFIAIIYAVVQVGWMLCIVILMSILKFVSWIRKGLFNLLIIVQRKQIMKQINGSLTSFIRRYRQ